ncbi:MAG: hypothetical protein Ct9H90mP27_2380 [Gammaproteobacteria bacterium]|nr:MAG: hypothetical protein Ct9H90mP27_2380 [Gammaproteobacteria bacterium]
MGFYIVALNLIGVVVGVTAGGWIIDALQAQGRIVPTQIRYLGFTFYLIISQISPFSFLQDCVLNVIRKRSTGVLTRRRRGPFGSAFF